MIDRISGWVDGFMAASRIMSQQPQAGWFTPETLLAAASLIAALMSAKAAFSASNAAKTSNKSNAYQAISARRLEILRISSENIADLLIIKERFRYKMLQAKSDALRLHPKLGQSLAHEIVQLVDVTCNELDAMISANEIANDAVFLENAGGVSDWDEYIRGTLKKKQQITHIKVAIDLKSTNMKRRAASLLSA